MTGCIPFLLPALWNGFAIVFFDTGGYIDRVMEMTLYPGRSFFYGFFLWMTSFGWWFFWGPIILKSLLCLWIIHLLLRCHHLPSGPLVTAASCVGLSLMTGVSWYTSQLMPDILVPMVVVALWLLGTFWQKLRHFERAGLLATALLGIISHNSCLALAIGLLPVLLAIKLTILPKGGALSLALLPPVAAVVAGLILIPLGNWALVGKMTYSSGGEAFLFARFIQSGIAQRWLAANCPTVNFRLCKMQQNLPKTSDEFLWSRTSPFQALGAWNGVAAQMELGQVVVESIKDYPGEVLLTSFEAAVDQFLMVETGDGLDNYQDYTRKVFANLSPEIAEEFQEAEQQQNLMTQNLFDILNTVHLPVAYVSLFGLVIVAVWGLRKKHYDFAGLATYVLIALWGNAIICGALSSPFDRYQSRLVWLATLVVGMAGAGWWFGRDDGDIHGVGQDV